ncbi:hypothetical protein MTR67_004451 [Solanum verrucosum]|uniref:Uncharacterized protein n=1 Tax=Solanum verrucosum TaxID=315347 RepID=A0AAF0PYW9_SOLVR|nr:hypothetical protein MTR67_004451 [Solanum verrucosum]
MLAAVLVPMFGVAGCSFDVSGIEDGNDDDKPLLEEALAGNTFVPFLDTSFGSRCSEKVLKDVDDGIKASFSTTSHPLAELESNVSFCFIYSCLASL